MCKRAVLFYNFSFNINEGFLITPSVWKGNLPNPIEIWPNTLSASISFRDLCITSWKILISKSSLEFLVIPTKKFSHKNSNKYIIMVIPTLKGQGIYTYGYKSWNYRLITQLFIDNIQQWLTHVKTTQVIYKIFLVFPINGRHVIGAVMRY